MSVEQLITEHLDIWTAADTEKKSGRGRSSGSAGSVYGVKKLRELILELAVRGKLVPQDDSDEPASEHLQNINRELCSLINVPSLSLLRRDKSTIDPEDFHFTLPNSWLWCELQNIAIFENGKAHEQYVVEKEKFVLVNSSYISSNGGKIKYVSNRLSPLSKDDIAIVMSDVPSGRALVRCFLVTDSDNFTLNQRIGALKTGSTLSKHYLLMVLDRNKYYLQYDDGKKQSNLKKIQILSCPIPLPPLAEQHRIVAKVDELMALCDQLENQHNNAAEAHDKLVTHLLGTLTQSQNAEDFNSNWRRISSHFDSLFTTEASIDALKQTLLQLAVMGKLVPQDPNDVPASELLKRIQAEKTKLIAEGKIKKDKPLAAITDEEKPFDLPVGWEWVRINTIGHDWGQKNPTSDFTYIEVSAIDSKNGIISTPQLVEFENAPSRARKIVKAGTVIYSTVRPYLLNIAVIEKEFIPEPIASTAFAIVHPFCSMPPRYFLFYFRSPIFVSYVESVQMGIAYPAINDGQFFSGLLPLPPLAEQHRIVAKVDELMALCDQLKSRLTAANQLQQKIADVMTQVADC